MTAQMEAILMIAEHDAVRSIFDRIIDTDREEIHWDRLNYGVLSGGQKAAVSWAWCIWNDMGLPSETHDQNPRWDISIAGGWRDPFEGWCNLSASLQLAILQALAHRSGVFRGLETERMFERILKRKAPAPAGGE